MSRTPKYVRESLVELMKGMRAEQRCDKVKELLQKFKNDNPELYRKRDNVNKELDDVRQQLSELRKKERELESEERKVNRELDKAKRESLLHSTTPSDAGTCRAQHLHPELEKFDMETKRLEIKILTQEEVDEKVLDM